MKAKYTGKPVNNFYGLSLVTGEEYEIPSSLEAKVKANPNFEVKRGNRSGSKKQSVKKSTSS